MAPRRSFRQAAQNLSTSRDSTLRPANKKFFATCEIGHRHDASGGFMMRSSEARRFAGDHHGNDRLRSVYGDDDMGPPFEVASLSRCDDRSAKAQGRRGSRAIPAAPLVRVAAADSR